MKKAGRTLAHAYYQQAASGDNPNFQKNGNTSADSCDKRACTLEGLNPKRKTGLSQRGKRCKQGAEQARIAVI
jgi:hypothetical protein